MELKPIKTQRDHKAALKLAESLWDAPEGSAESDALDVLVTMIERYEAAHHPIAAPDPVEFLTYVMESRELTRKDLEPYIGSRARVAEVLNRVRPLSLDMIRRLSAGLKVPADVLIREYPLRDVA